MTTPQATPPYRLGSWQFAAVLALVEAGIIAWCTPIPGPERGEAAIGAFLFLGVAIAMYAVQLVAVTPLVIWHSVRRGNRLRSRRSLWILAPLVPAPAFMGLLVLMEVSKPNSPGFRCDDQEVALSPDAPPNTAPITACEPADK